MTATLSRPDTLGTTKAWRSELMEELAATERQAIREKSLLDIQVGLTLMTGGCRMATSSPQPSLMLLGAAEVLQAEVTPNDDRDVVFTAAERHWAAIIWSLIAECQHLIGDDTATESATKALELASGVSRGLSIDLTQVFMQRMSWAQLLLSQMAVDGRVSATETALLDRLRDLLPAA